jgi:hypothetical protein
MEASEFLPIIRWISFRLVCEKYQNRLGKNWAFVKYTQQFQYILNWKM